MAENAINTRVLLKNDTEQNWSTQTNFIPKKGELIIYNPDTNNSALRIKVGDGVTTITDLPFLLNVVAEDQ